MSNDTDTEKYEIVTLQKLTNKLKTKHHDNYNANTFLSTDFLYLLS